MRARFLVLVVALIFVSGCPGPAGVGDGVKIKSFAFDSASITDKEQVELALEVENVGAYDASDVNFYLYGFDTDVWESLDVDASSGEAAEDGWTVDELRGRDMETGAQGVGAGYYQTFGVGENRIARGITQKYSFMGRLCYYYETRANAKVKAISAAEKRDQSSKGTYSPVDVEVFNSYGPLEFEVKTKSPLVFYGSSGGQETELALIIKNSGPGFPAESGCSQDVGVETMNRLAGLEVSLDGEAVDCEDSFSFFDGQAVVYCTYTAGDPRPKAEYLFSVVAKYYYYDDVSASVSVVGTSDEVTVGEGGGGKDGIVYKGGYCEQVCEATAGQDERFKGLAMCVEGTGPDVGVYPGTSVKVMIKDVSNIGDYLKGKKVYLENLKLHDVLVEDIKLTSLSAVNLNKPGVSSQYSYETLKVDSDGDGLPDEWEDSFIGLNNGSYRLSSKKKDSNDDGVSDGDEICVKCSGGSCDSTKTYRWNFQNGCMEQEYHDRITLGLTGSLDDARVTSTANPSVHKIDPKEPVLGMRIVGIGGKTIAEMTGESKNSRIQAIKYIDVEKLDLSQMGVVFDNLFLKTKCKNSNTPREDDVCKCVVDLDRMGPDEEGYPPLATASTSRCDTKCGNMGYEGGVCIPDNFDGKPSDHARRCEGSKLVRYSMDISVSDSENYDCSPDRCYCYEVEKSLSTLEKRLMCISG